MSPSFKHVGFAFLVCAGLWGPVGCDALHHGGGGPGESLVAQGSEALTYEAPTTGKIWVRDARTGSVDYSARVAVGDLLMVDPGLKQITLNGKPVSSLAGDAQRDKCIYYEPLPAATK